MRPKWLKPLTGLAVLGGVLGIASVLVAQNTVASEVAAPLTPAQAHLLAQVDAQGDWRSPLRGHQVWRVVDADPQGVNCRWSNANPRDWYAPHRNLPNRSIYSWSPVRQFQRGSVLVANTTPAGFSFMYDDRGLPWIKVDIGPNDEICMVRANSRFIQPMPVEIRPVDVELRDES